MLEFLKAIYGETSGWVAIVNRNPETDKIDSEAYRHWPEDQAYLAKYCQLRADEDTYCTVALFHDKHRTNDDVLAQANVVWADADTCDPSNFRVTPSIIVETSPGRWHVWWVLDETVNAGEAARVSQKIAYAHRDQGCDLGWFVSKILRVPGTTNRKDPNNPHRVTVEYTGAVYTLSELDQAYSEVNATGEVVHLDDKMPAFLSLSELKELEQRVIKNSPYENLYTTPPDTDWSNKLFRFQFDLFREGLTAREVFTLSKHSACNKFARDGRPDTDLWRTVQNAYHKYVGELESAVGLEPHRVAVLSSVPSFLTEKERDHVESTENIIDRYVQWVAQRTDAAPTYNRSLAYLLLSCVFGNRGYLPDPYGKQFLNLWLLILGPSTATRKTTAKKIALAILHDFENRALQGDRIDIASDITKEGLGKELGERDGKVSLVQTDEVAGMFREFYAKNYQTGTLTYLTDLYEGSVPVALRATKDAGQKNRVSTVFNMLGIGIPEDVAEVLTEKDFESGFLMRMLWSVADAPPRQPGSDDYPDEPEGFTDDAAEVSRWAADLTRRASRFSMETPSKIRIDPQARKRYNLWAESIRQHAEKSQNRALNSAVSRLQHSVRKSAALLAMYDGVTIIQPIHLLIALKQAEFWYADLLRMLHMVSSSSYERLLDQVEAFISGGTNGTQKDAMIRRKFAGLRPQEIAEVLLSLERQGRIRKNGESMYQILA